MKKNHLLYLFLVIAFTLNAQVKTKKVDVLMGSEQKVSRVLTLTDIIGHDKTGIYAIKKKAYLNLNGYVYIEKYSNSMSLIKSLKLDLSFEGKDMTYEFGVQMNDEIYVFSSFKNQKTEKNYLFVQSLNKETMLLNKDLVKIAEIDFSGGSKRNSGEFGFETSMDEAKLLVFYTFPYERKEDEKVGFAVFGTEMKKIWGRDITIPHKDKLFNVEGYKVDDSGNVYLLGWLLNDGTTERVKGKANYSYQIVSLTNNGETTTEYPVVLEDKFLTDMQIAINKEHDIICAGFYSSKGSFSIGGSYFLKIDPKTKEIKTKNFKEFSLDFITQNLTESQEKKVTRKAEKGKDVELMEFYLDDIVIKEDGGAVLIGEQFYIRHFTSSYTDSRGMVHTRTTTYYYYNDIIVINIDATGNIVWAEKIGKRQITQEDGGFWSSYVKAIVGDKMYFVFNDHPENLMYKGTGKLKNFNKSKESLTVLVEIDASGKQTREAIFSSEEAEILVRPKVCEQINEKELVLFGQKRKNQKFIKLTFK